MRAVLRVGLAIATAGLWLGHGPALAQSAPAATTNTPAADAIGPRELQDFNLQGTVTRSGDPAPASRNAPPSTRERSTDAVPGTTAPTASATDTRSRPAEQRRTTVRAASAPPPPAPRALQHTPPRTSSITVDLPPVGSSVTSSPPAPVPAAAATFSDDAETATLAPEDGLSVWPWLLATAALGAGAAFLLWRRNSREAFAGGPPIDAFVAPEPAPPVRVPEPATRPAPPAPKPVGLVSTRLRPSLEISFQPLRCIVEETQVRLELEISLLNSGSAPARDILIEAKIFNASPTQDSEIGGFFDQPAARGETIASLLPMRRVELRPQLVIARDQLRVLEAGGRKLFVPLIAFNALYRWGGNAGQTSAAFLIGRDTKGEKLAPFRLDLGRRIFRSLGARPLPISVRK
ncbi:MAG: hypothetical protein ACJ8FL_01890 [Sphingomicrobium sp.]